MTDHKSIGYRILGSDFYLWIGFFLFAVIVSTAVQFVVLPLFLPHLHWGEGLLKGTDSISYHLLARGRADLIVREGWSRWLLSPSGQTPAGITSFFYALFVPKPWVLIPLFAAMQAAAVLVLFKIISLFDGGRDRLLSLCSVIPFLLFPSAVFWYAQLQRDGFFIFGNLLFVYSWLRWLTSGSLENSLSPGRFIFFVAAWAVAFLFAWVVRPYWGPVFFFLSILFFIMLTIRHFVLFLKDRTNRPPRVIYWALSLIIVLGFGTASQLKKLPRAITSEASGKDQLRVELQWTASPWLPAALDSRLQALGLARQGFIVKYPEAGTNLDAKVAFHDSGDVAAYLLRAMYIGFAMPTSQFAFQKGVNPGGTLMRWVTGSEMVFLYLTYPFLIWAVWTWRKRTELWAVLIWGGSGILAYALVSPNIGALYRFRYGFLMTLSSIGILRAAMLLKKIVPLLGTDFTGGTEEKEGVEHC